LGDHSDRLVALSRQGRVAILGNALDYIPEDARRRYEAEIYDPCNDFAQLGLEAENLDLRRYFNDAATLKTNLRKFSLVWALGGNSFLLLRAMHQSGFSNVIREMLDADEIAYGGFSAGSVVATPTLRGIESMDDPAQIADGYPPEAMWDGLSLVDFSIVPHYRSDHPEAEHAESAVNYMRAHNMPFRTLADGDVFIVDGGNSALLRRKNGGSDVS
jgi:dipeptidase E